MPWHTHLRADAQPLPPDVPVALDFAFSATAYALQPGDLLRLSLSTRNPRAAGAQDLPEVSIVSDALHPSWIEVPDVDTREHALQPELGWRRVGRVPPLIGSARARTTQP